MNIRYNKKIVHLMVGGIITLLTVSSARTLADSSQSVTIQANNSGCSPTVTQVAPWTTITWRNTGSVPISIVSDNYFGGPISPGNSYIFTFSGPGQYRYSCRPVGTPVSGSDMVNVIQVTGGGYDFGPPQQPAPIPPYNPTPTYTPPPYTPPVNPGPPCSPTNSYYGAY
jgi:plastocyanin